MKGSWDEEAKQILNKSRILGGGFKHFLFSPLLGEDSQFDFSIGLKPPTSIFKLLCSEPKKKTRFITVVVTSVCNFFWGFASTFMKFDKKSRGWWFSLGIPPKVTVN